MKIAPITWKHVNSCRGFVVYSIDDESCPISVAISDSMNFLSGGVRCFFGRGDKGI
jgi:hypothetical protein